MEVSHTLNLVILAALLSAGMWTVMARSLIRSALGLALTSAVLTLVMFRFDSWLAAVFELSVCAGLISVVFISTISITEPLTREEVIRNMRERMRRFGYLPLIVLVVGLGLSLLKLKFNLPVLLPEVEADARKVLWYARNVDLLGQVLIMVSGIFGVVVLFKEMYRK